MSRNNRCGEKGERPPGGNCSSTARPPEASANTMISQPQILRRMWSLMVLFLSTANPSVFDQNRTRPLRHGSRQEKEFPADAPHRPCRTSRGRAGKAAWSRDRIHTCVLRNSSSRQAHARGPVSAGTVTSIIGRFPSRFQRLTIRHRTERYSASPQVSAGSMRGRTPSPWFRHQFGRRPAAMQWIN